MHQFLSNEIFTCTNFYQNEIFIFTNFSQCEIFTCANFSQSEINIHMHQFGQIWKRTFSRFLCAYLLVLSARKKPKCSLYLYLDLDLCTFARGKLHLWHCASRSFRNSSLTKNGRTNLCTQEFQLPFAMFDCQPYLLKLQNTFVFVLIF